MSDLFLGAEQTARRETELQKDVAAAMLNSALWTRRRFVVAAIIGLVVAMDQKLRLWRFCVIF